VIAGIFSKPHPSRMGLLFFPVQIPALRQMIGVLGFDFGSN